jgi:hypothetical protein
MSVRAMLLIVFLYFIVICLIAEVVDLWYTLRPRKLPPPDQNALRRPEVDEDWEVGKGKVRVQ